MKTKTFEVHPKVIKDAVIELINTGEKITKKNIIKLIDDRLRYIITMGNTDLPMFGQGDWDELVGDEYDEGYENKVKEINGITNEWVNKF